MTNKRRVEENYYITETLATKLLKTEILTEHDVHKLLSMEGNSDG